MAQIFAKVLHLLQELFTFVQREFTLAVGAVQQLVLSVVVGKKKGKMKKKRLRRPFHQGASFLFFLSLSLFQTIGNIPWTENNSNNLHNAPLFAFLDFGEEVVVDGRMAQVRLQAECQLQEPFPLSR